MLSKIAILVVLLFVLAQVESKCPFSKMNKGNCPFSFKPKTVKKCVCATKCMTKKTVAGGVCDFCYTKGKCGLKYGNRYIDFCTYPKNKKYERFSARAKLNYLWARLSRDRRIMGIESDAGFFASSMAPTMDAVTDVFPTGRPKNVRAAGVVCKFVFETSERSPYTGLWAPGAESRGIVRMSFPPIKKGLSPGVGVKFLRSGVPSANFVAINQLGVMAGDNFDYFKVPLRNTFPWDQSKALRIEHERQVSQCPMRVGLSDICTYNSRGRKTRRPNFPFEIEMVKADIEFPSKRMREAELYRRFGNIPVGSALYDFYAYSSPLDKKNGNYIYLGTMYTDSKCISSHFGDHKLFFKHQRFEEDMVQKTSWLKELRAGNMCNIKTLVANLPRFKQCPPRSAFTRINGKPGKGKGKY